MGDIFKEFLDKAPDIIDKAAQSPLGLAALSVLVLGIIGAFLFRNAAGKLKLAAFAMITGGFFGFMALVLIPSFLWSQPPEPPAKKMAIIAIFPLDSFGPNCRDGFLTAMHAETNIMPVMIDDVTIAEMKAGKTQFIDQHLRNAFATYNVLGVIGPPISEIASQIASSVADLNSKVPVLLTAAISANDPIWPILRQRLPMFRVGSGVGQRAAEVQTFLTHLLSQGKKIVFLVEHHATPDALSFGVMFFHDVEKQMNDFSNISTNDYQRIYFASSRIEELGEFPTYFF
jgi:hypothetical protein